MIGYYATAFGFGLIAGLVVRVGNQAEQQQLIELLRKELRNGKARTKTIPKKTADRNGVYATLSPLRSGNRRFF